MDQPQPRSIVGRGSDSRVPNRFEKIRIEPDEEQISDEDFVEGKQKIPTEYLDDQSESIVTENHSPDLPFRYSLNPYRGCAHGCSYCYARPTHEYLGFNAGIDFESRIVVKRDAPRLFLKFLARPSWQPEPISFSGVTDCYQPIERKLQITRACLQVALDFGQPVSIVTKNAMITRDLDILTEMSRKHLVHVYISVTTLDAGLARHMEPRTSVPAARLRTIEALSRAEIPVGTMVAPVIPGLNDSEIPQILEKSRNAGAQAAGYVLLRLPLTVQMVFEEWLCLHYPDRAALVMGRVKQTRGGRVNDSTFGQ